MVLQPTVMADLANVERARRIMMTAGDFEAALNAERQKAQRFFAELAAEMRKPHFGEAFREYQRALLTRAQEANLYTPENP